MKSSNRKMSSSDVEFLKGAGLAAVLLVAWLSIMLLVNLIKDAQLRANAEGNSNQPESSFIHSVKGFVKKFNS